MRNCWNCIYGSTCSNGIICQKANGQTQFFNSPVANCSSFKETKKIGFCPICDKSFKFAEDQEIGHCPVCKHHLALKGVKI